MGRYNRGDRRGEVMALETLKDVKEIGGFEIGRPSKDNDVYKQCDELSKFIVINDKTNCIAFRIQNGPIKEVGVNGCQVDTMIETCFLIIKGLNEKFPCEENKDVMDFLSAAITRLEMRKRNREKRQVEGTSQP
jgi:hypothetical protein